MAETRHASDWVACQRSRTSPYRSIKTKLNTLKLFTINNIVYSVKLQKWKKTFILSHYPRRPEGVSDVTDVPVCDTLGDYFTFSHTLSAKVKQEIM